MTNATAVDARAAQEPLGTLLVRRGLITDEQLAVALQAQKETGEPLGKIVVERGFARPDVVAQALATQHGGLLKTEYGFATGFANGAPLAAAIVEPPVSAPSPLRAELAHASEEAEKLREDNQRLALLRAELEQRLAAETQKVAALERELADAGEGSPAGPEIEKQVAEATRRVAQLEGELAARDAAIEDFKETAESWKKALAERDDAIRTLVAARDEALAKLDELPEASTDGPTAAETEELRARVAELEAALRTADEASDTSDLRAELAQADERLAVSEESRVALLKQNEELEEARADALAQLRAAKAELAERDAKLPAALEELNELKAALEGRDAALAELAGKLESVQAPAPSRWDGAERHLLFFAGADGYELVERAGPPPAAGDTVQVPGGPLVVARIAASPAPGPKLPCAYLTA
ncbi:MAG TPA: hypothetical protein VFA56_02135 [Gaiellaceae bacterium]|nr:hypothetical protein [Gaiellaceae bacterium]